MGDVVVLIKSHKVGRKGFSLADAIISSENNYVILKNIIPCCRKESIMFNLSDLDFSKLNAAWATIVAATLGGWFVVVGAIAGSTAHNLRKWMGIILVTLVTTGLTYGILYVSGVIPPPSPNPTPILFDAQVTYPLGASIRSSPSLEGTILDIVDRNVTVKVKARVLGRGPISDRQTWYQVDVISHSIPRSGYMLGTMLQLSAPPGNPNATPPLVTLTPNARP